MALEYLTTEEGNNFAKLKLFLEMKKAETMEQFLSALSSWKADSYTAVRLKELL